MAIEVKWEGPVKSGISSLYKKSHQVQSFFSKEIELLKLEEPIEWNNEFDHICNFSISSKDPTLFSPWIVTFHILYGKSEEQSSSTSSSTSGKMQVIGKAKLNLGELASKMEEQLEQKIPMTLELDGVIMESTLQLIVSFIEMKETSHSRTLSHDSFGSTQNSNNSSSLLRRANSQGATLVQEKAKKNKTRLFGKQWSMKNPGASSATLNSESEYVVVASSSKSGESNSVTESKRLLSSETQLDLVKKGGFWKWKRRKSMKKEENVESTLDANKSSNPSSWEERELMSRDGRTKLKANVFFASFDQRSEQAAGGSACAAIVAIVAHWLQVNPDLMLTGPEFDRLITEGSLEWRKLCNHESNKDFQPDHHFDLETILRAELRPLAVLPNNSRFGFFHPEEFDHLKDAASFDEIWNEINTNVNELEPRVYIVRWNEHFFILKVEANVNYIIDSLGERLYEGCNQAYVLKFDDSTVMLEKGEEKSEDKVICKGKECCREYMKRFLAAIPLRELKEEEAKGKTVDVFVLYKRLQIDFHLSSNSSAVSTANTSNTASPDTQPLFLGVDEFVQV
ncbi:hypothetical protein BVRB_2g030260 [Beta vulgaris subsp. vulgaris]|nr:hypothetical protein BVRB_2g030260 [Beta vulgaris subsp. vulgaris]